MAAPSPTPVVYQHRQLEGVRYIRLLKVRSHADSGIHIYEIIETSLDDAPLYETVSYVWGEAVSLKRLPLQSTNSFIDVTLNLASALEHLVQNCRTNHLWIDQICINQINIAERNQQVRIMGEIYAQAQRTLIWLGDEDPNSNHLKAALKFTTASILKNEPFDVFSQGIHPLLGDTGDSSNTHRQQSVRELLCRPWFSRAWVVQEAVLARLVTFIVGSLVFDLDALWAIIRKVRNIDDRSRRKEEHVQSIRQSSGYLLFNQILTLRKQRQSQKETAKGSFFYTLSVLAPRCGTSLPNDKILAFLGLLNEPMIRLELDYSIPLDVLPIMTTASVINGTGSLDIFGILHRIAEDQSQWFELPSWVPNFSKRLKAETMNFPESPPYFNASAGFKYKSKLSTFSTELQLTVYGKIIDEISFRLPFTEALSAPASSRQEWDVHTYLRIFNLHRELKHIWPSDRLPPTADYVLATALADGSFAFDEKERAQCRNGLSDEQKRSLLEVYESLDPTSINYGSRSQRQRALDTILRDHARVAWDRAMIVSGRLWALGLAHESARAGDLVSIIHGSTVPLILRKVEGNMYRLIGQCYLSGVMKGEAVSWSEDDADEFRLV